MTQEKRPKRKYWKARNVGLSGEKVGTARASVCDDDQNDGARDLERGVERGVEREEDFVRSQSDAEDDGKDLMPEKDLSQDQVNNLQAEDNLSEGGSTARQYGTLLGGTQSYDGEDSVEDTEVREEILDGRNDSNAIDDVADSDGKYALVYNYLNQAKIGTRRSIARHFGIKQHTRKENMIANIMVWLLVRRKDGRDVQEFIDELKKKSSWEFDSFLQKKDLHPRKFKETPDWKTIQEIGDPYRKKRSDTKAGESAPSLSPSEFARLMVQIRDEDESREALLKSRSQVSRRELDAPFKGECWKIIEEQFNDPEYRPTFDVSDFLSDVDASEVPMEHVSGASLRKAFVDTKGFFSVYMTRWRKSGSRDPDDAEECFDIANERTNDFTNFLPLKASPVAMQNQGKFALIVFICLRCHDMKLADKELLGIFWRENGGRAEIGFESGIPRHEKNATSSERKRGKKRGRSGDDVEVESRLGSALCDIAETQKHLLDSQKRKLESQGSLGPTASTSGVNMLRLQQQQDLMNMMKGARKLMEENKDDQTLHDVAKTQFENLLGNFNQLRNSGSGH